jgi:flagellar hook assembly protein FlgD
MSSPISASSRKPVIASSEQSASERAQKMKNDFMKIMVASMKNINPFSEKSQDQGNMTQTMATLEQTAQAIESKESIDKLAKIMQDSKFSRALPLQGKEVKYDVSTKDFNGTEPVKFKYQIKYDDARRPPNSYISTMIGIFNKNGIEVCKKKGKTEKGTHEFTWNGEGNDGETLSEGAYKIKVESYICYLENGVERKIPIEAGSYLEGTIEALEKEGDEVFAIINGKQVKIDDIVQIDFSKDKKEVKYKLSDYADFIGKTVLTSNDILEIKGGKAKLSLNIPDRRPGKIGIKIFDDAKNIIGTAVVTKSVQGINNINFTPVDCYHFDDAESFYQNPEESEYRILKDGKYKIEVYSQNLLSDDDKKYRKLDLESQKLITSLDFSSGPYLVSGTETIHVDSISKLSAPESKSSLIDTAAKFIGKDLDVNLSKFKYQGSKVEQFIKIPPFKEGSFYGDVAMVIYDSSGSEVARVKKDKNAVILSEKSSVFYINKSDEDEYLDLASTYSSLSNSAKSTLLTDYGFDYYNEDGTIDPKFSNIYGVKSAFDTSLFPEKFVDFSKDLINKSAESGIGKKYDFSKIISGYESLPKQTQDYYKNSILVITDYAEIAPNYNSLSPEDQYAIRHSITNNNLKTGFIWDGTLSTGAKASNGIYSYKIELETHKISPSGADNIDISFLANTVNLKADEYRIEDGNVIFISKDPASDSEIIFSKEDIVKTY